MNSIRKSYLPHFLVLQGLVLAFLAGFFTHWIWMGRSSEKQVEKEVVQKKEIPVPDGYDLFVDYGRSVEDLVEASQFRWNPLILGAPLAKGENKEDQKRIVVKVFHFGKRMTSQAVMLEMAKDGYRPSTIREALYFGEKNPEEQTKHPIVALKQVLTDAEEKRMVFILWMTEGKRSASIAPVDVEWNKDIRFLGTKE